MGGWRGGAGWWLGGLVAAAMLLACQSARQPEHAPDDAPEEPSGQAPAEPAPEPEALAAFHDHVVRVGDARAEVEAALGAPEHTARTKAGQLVAIHGLGGWRRAFVYGADGRVLHGFPAPLQVPDPVLDVLPANPALVDGALSGASIFVNPGHGWAFYPDAAAWRTQRGVSHGIIEDHSNAEAVMQYLVPYLENAGARVYTTRERDPNPHSVIVDSAANGLRLEGAWSTEMGPGLWRQTGHSAPTIAAGRATAVATFAPAIPADGHYAVYAWYRHAASGTTSTATTFQIHHSGGTTRWVQNQNHDTRTWTYLGTYYFEASAEAARAAVVVDNATGVADQRVTVSAVRFGGGTANLLADGKPLVAPWSEVSGLHAAQFYGFSPTDDTRTFNTVSAMPMWAEWECEPHEVGRSVYLSWHTNATTTGQTRGLSSFVYSPAEWGTAAQFTGYPGGAELVQALHGRVLADVRAAFDPAWPDVGVASRWLGETNPRNNTRMPAVLMEYGFHDHPDDAAMILDPQFRRTVARATMHGLIDYFAGHVEGFAGATYPPEPPTDFRVVADPARGVVLNWSPASAGTNATAYMVEQSANGRGFDNGTVVGGTEMAMAHMAPGQLGYFRVRAVNAGGRSLPSEVLAATATRPGERGRVLYVNAFDRLDRGLNKTQPDGAERGQLDRMNTFDYVRDHAPAIVAAGFGIDSTCDESVDAALAAGRHDVVIWAAGRENQFAPGKLASLRTALNRVGRLYVSGAQLAQSIAPQDSSPLLGATRDLSAAGGAAGVSPPPGGRMPLLRLSDDGARASQSIAPDRDATTILLYGNGAPAGVAMNRIGRRVVHTAFPFESIADDAERHALMAAILDWLTEPAAAP